MAAVSEQRFEDRFAIVGLGMACSLGLDVVTACAAARAGIQRFAPLELRVTDQETLASVPLKGHVAAGGLTEGFEGMARWFQLGAAALQDLSAYARLDAALGGKNGFLIHLPGDFHAEVLGESQLEAITNPALQAKLRAAEADERKAFKNRFVATLLPRLIAEQPLTVEAARFATFGGASALLKGVAQALDLIGQGRLDRCIVGAVDSAVEPSALAVLHRLGLLQTPDRPVGFFPGEAAAFFLIEGIDSARRRNARIEATLGMPATTVESSHRFGAASPLGLALSAAARQCLAGSPGTAVDHVIVNLNGDPLRAQELGGAYQRLQAADLALPASTWCPAQSFGETGAATVAASICLAVRGFAKHYVPGHTVLIMSMDDEAERGAVLVKAPADSLEGRHGR